MKASKEDPWVQFSVHSVRQGTWAETTSCRALKATLQKGPYPQNNEDDWRVIVCGLEAGCSVRAAGKRQEWIQGGRLDSYNVLGERRC